MSRSTPILITGPTASGKSGLALALAETLGGVVINADSMQVYRDLRLLTARPGVDDEHRAPHRLYGHVDGSEAYSAGRFAREVAGALAEAKDAGLRPIIAGGTGLYFRALLEGLSPMPAIPDDIRAHWRSEAQRLGPEALHAALAGRDAVMAARLSPTDPQRVTRALEVLEATGTSLDVWQQQPGTPVIALSDCVKLIVMPDRDEVYRRSEQRFDQMIAEGALDEVQALRSRALDPALPVMRALGVKPLIQHLAGELPLEAAVDASKAETRQFIKRQLTWFKGNMSSWNCIFAQLNESLLRQTMPFIDP